MKAKIKFSGAKKKKWKKDERVENRENLSKRKQSLQVYYVVRRKKIMKKKSIFLWNKTFSILFKRKNVIIAKKYNLLIFLWIFNHESSENKCRINGNSTKWKIDENCSPKNKFFLFPEQFNDKTIFYLWINNRLSEFRIYFQLNKHIFE